MKTPLPLLILALAIPQMVVAEVPSTINYQGRLTNDSGVPQSGTRAMSVKVYNAATAGTLLYSETVGNVTVDANGVYSFQFGASGSSNPLVTETLATTDGTTATYVKALANTPTIPGTLSVTDGTFNWDETTGNPGSPATATATVISGFVVGADVNAAGSGYTSPPAVSITGNGTGATATATVSSGGVSGITITNAGSGYTSGATITIAPPPAPFLVNVSGGSVTVTYDTPPAAGRAITATYRYSGNGISGALASGAEQWLELTVDGTAAQSPRQKVLAVPFAVNAKYANTAKELEKSTKTGLLAYFGGKILPITVYPTQSLIGQSISLSRPFELNISLIKSISTEVLISSGNSTQYPAGATVEIVAYSIIGTRTVIATKTLIESGTLTLEGPFDLDHESNEYVLECGISTGGSYRATKNTTLNPIKIKYE